MTVNVFDVYGYAHDKLLRVLQQKEVVPVGAAHPTSVNVRIISATNRDLAADVESGRFRDDLYFRLNVLQVHLPSLRDRREDIPALVRHFIERLAAGEARQLRDITPAAMEMLKGRKWPGNVREMENALHRAMVMAEGDAIDVKDFSVLPVGQAGGSVATPSPVVAHRTLAEIEAEAIQNALIYSQGNMTLAAQILGIAKSTLYRKIQPTA